MLYREIDPPPHLAPFVRCFWLLEEQEARLPGPPERVLPDGCVEFVVHHGDPYRFSGGGVYEKQPRGIVAGQLSSAAFLRSTGRVGMVGLRFHPGGAHPLLREPLDRLTDRFVSSDDLFGPPVRALEREIRAVPDNARRIQALVRFLERRVQSLSPASNSLARHAAREITQRRGMERIGALARRLGCSRRTLERHFRTEVGLSPKALARIERFQGFATAIASPARRDWTDLALGLGYCDLGHASREFRSLAGTSPSGYLGEEHALSDRLLGA